jgi:lysozyme
MAAMKMGPHGLAVVKAFESCMAAVKAKPGYFAAYVDPVGVLTIGWGHTNHHLPKFDGGTVWSQAQCDAALAGDMAIFEAHVNRLAKVPLEQHEFDALVSWAYNTGGPSTASLWTLLNSGDKASIPANLAQWNKGGGRVLAGLTRRRKAEGLLFQGKIKEAYEVAQIAKSPAKTPTPEMAGAVVAAGAAGAAHEAGLGFGWCFAIGIVAVVAAFLIWNLRRK